MKRITLFLFLSVLLITTLFAQQPEIFNYDLGFVIENSPESGSINFKFYRVGILFSGDNLKFDDCEPLDKV